MYTVECFNVLVRMNYNLHECCRTVAQGYHHFRIVIIPYLIAKNKIIWKLEDSMCLQKNKERFSRIAIIINEVKEQRFRRIHVFINENKRIFIVF